MGIMGISLRMGHAGFRSSTVVYTYVYIQTDRQTDRQTDINMSIRLYKAYTYAFAAHMCVDTSGLISISVSISLSMWNCMPRLADLVAESGFAVRSSFESMEIAAFGVCMLPNRL